MWNRLGIAFGLGAAAAGGYLWVARAIDQPDPRPPVVVVQAPPPPPAAYMPTMRVIEPAKPAAKPTRPAPPTPASVPRQKPAPFVVAQAAPPEPPPAPPPAAKPVSISDMAALPPPNLPTPSVANIPTPLPPGAEPPKPEVQEEKPAGPKTPRSVTLAAGTMVTVRLRETLTTAGHSKDDGFNVTLDAPLIINGLAIAERGSMHKGRIVELVRASRMGGRAKIGIELTQLTLSDGQTVDVTTDTFVQEGEGADKSGTLARTATLAGIAASIGGMASGGKGAMIGAGIGAAAGAGSVIFRKSPEIVLNSETRLTFRVKSPVTITEQVK